MGAVADLARRYAELHPWTSISWKQLKPRKNLIVLPSGFQAVLDCLKTDDQTAVVMLKPEDVQPDWFTDDYSSIVLFSTAEFAGTTRWAGTWTLILQQVAKGTELIVLPGPENDQDWRKSVDMLRDLCEETIAQRPSLKSCIKCLLPMKSEFEVIGAAFRTAKFEHGKVFTQSAAKRFWTATTTQHAGILKLAPFKRLAEQATSSAPRNPRPQQGQQSAWRCQQRRGGQAYKHQRTPRIDRPLQVIGNRMFRLVPVSDSRSHTRGGSYRGRNHGTHKKF
ncbi:unnamed protein product [Nippostrongylus brasiliensis]|uniref:DUF4780 domain-containing protein n=1 Tax=Nippostrongylus brasiliensis TaxID=27835 RepID=A0A0N4YSK5_NIPBR|nr:unnamed protein product [Nippostrongylus brasiliensis]